MGESAIGVPFKFDVALGLLFSSCSGPVRRQSWPKGKIVVKQNGYPDGIYCNEQTAEAWRINKGDLFKCAPYLQIRDNDMHYMWTPSTEDLFAEDWEPA